MWIETKHAKYTHTHTRYTQRHTRTPTREETEEKKTIQMNAHERVGKGIREKVGGRQQI